MPALDDGGDGAPSSLETERVRDEKVKVLRSLRRLSRDDRTLFTRWDEVEEAWRFVESIIASWKDGRAPVRFPNYPAGEWGPRDAETLLQRAGRTWYDGWTRCELWRKAADENL